VFSGNVNANKLYRAYGLQLINVCIVKKLSKRIQLNLAIAERQS